MATVSFRDTHLHTCGELPVVGDHAPDFTLTGADLSDIKQSDLLGKTVVLNVFPSIDTPTCQQSVRVFNEKAAALNDTVVLCVAMDLPFAMARFCGAEGIESVKVASGFRSSFGRAFGLELVDGPLRGLYARAVIVIDANGIVTHQELVDNLASEPNYDAALSAISTQ